MTIENQQAIAREVYSRLEMIDPYCILAGGAPRDWYFNEEANDLDFYFVSTSRTIAACGKQLNKVFGGLADCEIKPMKYDEGRVGMYKSMPDLIRVWETSVKEVPVQLIQLHPSSSSPQFKVVNNMDVSICQIAWKGDSFIQHQNFKKTIASGVMFLTHDDYQWSDKHGQKMKERFTGKGKQYYCGTSTQADSAIINKVLRGV